MRRTGADAEARALRRLIGLATLLVLVGTSGCGPIWLGRPRPATAEPEKITAALARVPAADELPGLVGRMQYHRVKGGETLLDVAREAGLGFHELRDANPMVDEWVPPPGAQVVVPSRWILPRSRYRGLVVNIPEMRMYVFPTNARAGELVPLRTWAVGIGTEEAPSPIGPFTIRSKDANPTWIVPDSILRTMDNPQRVVPPGPDNPMGAYRLRLSHGLYAIHGTNDPWSIGRLTTHGCIRLYPEDLEVLYPNVAPGTPGELVYQPVKFGTRDARVYVEVHADVYGRIRDFDRYARGEAEKAGVDKRIDVARFLAAVREKRGIPVDVTKGPTGGKRT
ncbi:MAG: L,D-transpeptidase family protein [Deltaproteobacteria bacterium]|nr:L,D-transpeptidase family protein [Deltaproteobacteria bacterium]